MKNSNHSISTTIKLDIMMTSVEGLWFIKPPALFIKCLRDAM